MDDSDGDDADTTLCSAQKQGGIALQAHPDLPVHGGGPSLILGSAYQLGGQRLKRFARNHGMIYRSSLGLDFDANHGNRPAGIHGGEIVPAVDQAAEGLSADRKPTSDPAGITVIVADGAVEGQPPAVAATVVGEKPREEAEEVPCCCCPS